MAVCQKGELEFGRYYIDIAALCETGLLENGSIHKLVCNYVLFWHGYPSGHKRLHAFIVASPVTYGVRLMKLTLKLEVVSIIHVISAYTKIV